MKAWLRVLALALVPAAGLATPDVAGAQTDRIEVSAGPHGQVTGAVVYLSGQRFGGVFCEFRPGVDVVVPNVTSGPSQVAVLSQSHGLHFTPSVAWEYLYNEARVFSVSPRVRLPVRVWVMTDAPQRHPVRELARAQTALDGALAGVTLEATVTDARSHGTPRLACGDRAELESSGLFAPHAVNVYYAECEDRHSPGETCHTIPGGWTCQDRRMAFVYGPASPTTLAHELAHALLGEAHWRVSGYDNLLETSARRTALSTGQAIRLNYDGASVLNTLRGQSGLDCDGVCPGQTLDIGKSCPLYGPAGAGGGSAAGPAQPPASPPLSPPARAVLEWFECVECVDQELASLVAMTPAQEVFDLLTLPLLDPAAISDRFSVFLGYVEAHGVPGESTPSRMNRWQRRGLAGLSSLVERGHPDVRPLTRTFLLGLDASKFPSGVGAEVVRLQHRHKQ